MKLRTHYFWLAFSIILPVALFSGIALKMLLNAQHDAAIKRIEQTVRATALAIDADINRAQSVLRTLAISNALATGNMRGFHEEARNANAGSGAWIILYDTIGRQLVNTRIAFGEPLNIRPDVGQLKEILRTGKGVVSGLKWGLHLKNHFVAVELPIVSSSGKHYVIAQAFSPSYFSSAFADRNIPPSWLAGIFDQNGTIIARRYRAEEFVGRRVRPEIFQAIRSSPSGLLRHTTSDGVEVYDVYTNTALSKWAIAIGAPVNEINSAVWRGVSVAFAGLVIAIIIASLMAVIVSRRLVRSISRASLAAILLGRGDKVASLDKSGIVELEELNQALAGASVTLHAEKQSRLDAENERNQLLIREQQARLLAEEQNKAKDEFLAMLGHELRNPLSAITSAVAVMDRESGADKDSRIRNVLRRQTGHLCRLVDDLLDVNRVLMGKVTLDTKHVDLGELVRDCIQTIQSDGQANAHAMTIETVPSWIDADPTRMAQIVSNILDNAVKYTPAGGLIHVEVRHVEDCVQLTVRDSGIGITPELLPKIFNMFVQGEQTLQREKGGLGIGLALVQRLVQMHGGTVEVHSKGPGLGSSVTVTLPRLHEDTVAVAVPVMRNAAPHRTVLLVEDHQDGREMMSMMLEAQHCEVLLAASGQEGIDIALSKHPEIAIIDIGLPGMDGYAVARALKQQPQTSTIRLIALTGYGTREDRQRALDAGFDLHLTKPVAFEQLCAALGTEIDML